MQSLSKTKCEVVEHPNNNDKEKVLLKSYKNKKDIYRHNYSKKKVIKKLFEPQMNIIKLLVENKFEYKLYSVIKT